MSEGVVMGVDPGKTTGVCIAKPIGKTERSDADFELMAAFELSWDERFKLGDYIQRFKDADGGFTIVMESFNLYPGAAMGQAKIHSDFPSVEVIGLVVAFSHMAGLQEPIRQTPSVRKRVQVMSHHKDQLSGMRHATDAYRHVRYYILSLTRLS